MTREYFYSLWTDTGVGKGLNLFAAGGAVARFRCVLRFQLTEVHKHPGCGPLHLLHVWRYTYTLRLQWAFPLYVWQKPPPPLKGAWW